MLLAVLYVAVNAIVVAVAMRSGVALNEFLATTPVIADQECLDRFKDVARRDMYTALAVIVLHVPVLILAVVLLTRYGGFGLLVVLATTAVVIGLSRRMRGLAQRARSLGAASEALASEHRRVSQSWVKKPFPDF